jgi:hypothetical protein
MIADHAVVIDNGAGVDNRVRSYSHACLQDRPSHDLRTLTEHDIDFDDRFGMTEYYKLEACRSPRLEYCAPAAVITDGANPVCKQHILTGQAEQHLVLAEPGDLWRPTGIGPIRR